uniref:Uncharacterized protein n=1 Tax=Nomascus leucogenys TaxID=61853 RepID=A0A2I3GQM9_NOMLE
MKRGGGLRGPQDKTDSHSDRAKEPALLALVSCQNLPGLREPEESYRQATVLGHPPAAPILLEFLGRLLHLCLKTDTRGPVSVAAPILAALAAARPTLTHL